MTYEPAIVGGVADWWCRPAGTDTETVILHLHGGAYVLGSAAAYRHLAGHIAAASGLAAFVPDYGLAPERPFPAALDDAAAVYGALGAPGSRIALVGDSAGGGLAIALAVLAAERPDGPKPPIAIVALSPWTDLSLTGGSMATRASRDPLLTREVLRGSAALYLAGHDARDPRASPLFGDLRGMPPILIHVGADEILLDDSLRLDERLAAAGGQIDTHVWERMTHVFPTNVRLEAARRALALCGDFLRSANLAGKEPKPG